MKRNTPLARSPIARSAFSPKRTASRGQREAYEQVKEDSNHCCAGCRGTWFLTPSHCFGQKQYPEHRDKHLNIIILCVNCHSTFEHNKQKFRGMYPAVWADIMARMKEVDAKALQKLRTLRPQLFR